MVLQNSSNQVFSNNADGYSLGGGVTRRTLTLTGADFPISLSAVGSGNILQYNGVNWVNVSGTTYGTGSVTSVATGTGLTGGPVTNTGTISVATNGVSYALMQQASASKILGNPGTSTANVSEIGLGTGLTFSGSNLQLGTSGVTAGSYGNGSNYTTFTVDALGRVTVAGTVALGNMAFQNSNNVNITGGTINMTSGTITVATPVNPSDAVNKSYVDGIAAGLDAKQAVIAATTGSLDATYLSDVLTENTNGALIVDGYTALVGDRILVKNQTGGNATENGIYVVTATGDVGNPYVLTRTTDMNATDEIPAAFTFVIQGSTNAGKGYVVTGFTETDVLDTDPINWTQFSQAGAYSASPNGGLSISTSAVPALFGMNFTNMPAGTALGTGNLFAISQDGTNVATTTLGSIATFITGGSALAAAVTSGSTAAALTYNAGTFTLNVDGSTVVAGTTGLSVGTIQTANIANSAVTYAKIQNETASTLLGNPGTASAAPSEIAISSNLQFNSGTLDLGTSITISGLLSAGTVENNGTQVLYAVGTGLTLVGADNGTVAMAISGVTAGSYTLSNITVDALGRVTVASSTTVGSGLSLTSGTLSVRVNGSGGIVNTPTGIALNISNLTTDPNALGTGDLSTISNGGTTYTTTLGSLAAFFASNSVFGTGAIHATNGTVSLLTTANFTQTAGTLDLSNTGVTPGTYSTVVVDIKGRVTAGTNNNLNWVDVTGTTQQLAPNTGYMADNSALVTLTLPVNANFGDIIPIVGYGVGGWLIAQNAGQIVHFGNEDSTSGVTGFLASTNRFDSLELFCAIANTEFIVRNSVGNIDIE